MIFLKSWKMKTKSDFIIDLLSSKKLSEFDREKILKLSASEFQNNENELRRIYQEVENLKVNFKTENEKLTSTIESVVKTLTGITNIEPIKNENRNNLSKNDSEISIGYIHTPHLTSKHLKLFKDGTKLKFTTHLYPNKDNDEFEYTKVTKDAISEFKSISKELPSSLQGIISRYLQKKKSNPHHNKIWYLGNGFETWWSPKVVNWCSENFGKHPITNDDIKENIIDPFKKSIEIRDGDSLIEAMNYKLKRTFGEKIDELNIDFTGVMNLTRIFTGVDQLMTGIVQLFDSIYARRANFPKVLVSTLLEEFNDRYCWTINILHVGSNISGDFQDNYDIISGNLTEAKKFFISLCDWEITVNYDNGTYKLHPLSIQGDLHVEKLNEQSKGFLHKLIFY